VDGLGDAGIGVGGEARGHFFDFELAALQAEDDCGVRKGGEGEEESEKEKEREMGRGGTSRPVSLTPASALFAVPVCRS
jgi:hypothetical protein